MAPKQPQKTRRGRGSKKIETRTFDDDFDKGRECDEQHNELRRVDDGLPLSPPAHEDLTIKVFHVDDSCDDKGSLKLGMILAGVTTTATHYRLDTSVTKRTCGL